MLLMEEEVGWDGTAPSSARKIVRMMVWMCVARTWTPASCKKSASRSDCSKLKGKFLTINRIGSPSFRSLGPESWCCCRCCCCGARCSLGRGGSGLTGAAAFFFAIVAHDPPPLAAGLASSFSAGGAAAAAGFGAEPPSSTTVPRGPRAFGFAFAASFSAFSAAAFLAAAAACAGKEEQIREGKKKIITRRLV